MRTHGPRMNPTRTREVLDKLGIPIEKSDGHGIEIVRQICLGDLVPYMVPERWRLHTGGGIAGNSDQVWLSPIVRTRGQPRGPYWNKGQLETALRAWRKGE
jgi:hypothetical protein